MSLLSSLISGKNSAASRITSLVAALLLSGSIQPIHAQGGFAFRTSSTQTYSKMLGANTVPAYVLLSRVPHQGIFIVSAPTEELGKQMGLAPGMVLLTIDSYSMTSSSVADSWLSHRGSKQLMYSVAVDDGGKPRIRAGVVQPPAPAAATATGTGAIKPMPFAGGPGFMVVPHGVALGTPAQMTSYCLGLINGSRRRGGLDPVEPDPTLERFGNDYAQYMANNYVSYDLMHSSRNPHQDLNGNGPIERAHSAGITNFLQESIGRSTGKGGMQTLGNLHGEMMASPEHRGIIMDPAAHHVGIGMAGSHNLFFLTYEFGS